MSIITLPIIFIKVFIALFLLTICGLLWLRKSEVMSILKKSNEHLVFIASWLLFRLVPFLIIYVFYNIEPTSDVIFYWNEVSKAVHGEMIYRDFFSPYSPLFVYFLAIWLKIWYHPKMIVLVMAMMEGLALFLANRFYKQALAREERLWRSLMYFVLPGALMFTVIGGQEDVWMWLFVLLAFLGGKLKNNTVVFSLLLALGILMTKAIFILVIIPFFITEKKKWAFTIPMALVGLFSFVLLYTLVGWEFLQPLDEAKILRAPNVLSVINPWVFNSISVGADFWNWAALILTMCLGVLTLNKFKAYGFQVLLSRFWVVLFGTMMIAQQSAYSGYLYLFLMPLVFYVLDWSNQRQVGLLFLYNLLCVLHPTLWWRLDLPKYNVVTDIFAQNIYILDYCMQLSIVLLTLYFIILAFRSKVPDKNVTFISSN